MKKNLDGSLAFYDPNYGAVFNLTEEELCEVMAESFYAYVTPNIPVIIALAVVAILIISGIVTAVHGYNTIATISLITCLYQFPLYKQRIDNNGKKAILK
ncbi:MAG: hypothetical protein ACEY3K_18140 [Wolbachia sp.]